MRDDQWQDDEEDMGDEGDEEGADLGVEAGSDVVPCPACGEDVFEDAEQCPHCGDYVVRSRSIWEGRPTWWVLLGFAGILITMMAVSC